MIRMGKQFWWQCGEMKWNRARSPVTWWFLKCKQFKTLGLVKYKDWQDMGAAWVTRCYFCMFTFTIYPIIEIDSRWEKNFVIRAESPWTSPLFPGRDLFQFTAKLKRSELEHFLCLGKPGPRFFLSPLFAALFRRRLLKIKTALLCFGIDWSNFIVMFN